jgi:hypothetical protein
VALSWAARFDMRLGRQIASLVYPLDTFSMYSPMPGTQESALIVRDHEGGAHRVTEFRSFDCDRALNAFEATCARERGIQYRYEDLVRYIESHAGPGQLDVELVSRTWELRPGEAPRPVSDCVVVHCRVSR